MIMAVMIGFSQPQLVKASSYKIRYGGKNYTYTSVQAGAVLDGKNIKMGKTPGLLINDVCMLPADVVFKKGLGMDYTYSSKANKIAFRQYGMTVKMTLDSKTATINGKKVTAEMAPMKIKLVNSGITKIYVPARFVAEAFGYGYNWNSTIKGSDMKSPFVIKYEKDWTVYKGKKVNATFNNKEIAWSDMPGLIFDNTIILPAAKVFRNTLGCTYSYDKATGNITITYQDKIIQMTVNEKEAIVNGEVCEMGTAARVVYNKQTKKSYVMVPAAFTAKKLGFEYNWDSDSATVNIKPAKKVYFNHQFATNPIEQIEASTVNKNETVEITGTEALKVTLSETEENHILMNIESAGSFVEGFTEELINSIYIKNVAVYTMNSNIVVDITKNKDVSCSYFTLSSGKNYRIIFSAEADGGLQGSEFQIQFDKPENFELSDVTTEDYYFDNYFVLTLHGDYSAFFDEHPIRYDSAVINNIIIDTFDNGLTEITVETNGINGFKLYDLGNSVALKVDKPRNIYDKIVVLDAGHGGKDNGASNKGTHEKDLNLTIIYEKAEQYFNSPESEIKAYWTREDDTYLTLDERAAYAKNMGADAFISLHMNSATASAKGLEVYYYSGNKNTMGGMSSQDMANIFYDQLIDDLGMTKRGVKSAKFVVIKNNTVPAILIELGFLSNTSDYAKLTDESFQDDAARSIYDATVQMFEEFSTGR